MTEIIQKKLAKLNINPSKDLGQNFLIDPSVVSSIIDFAKPKKDENLLEIGPGLGALTAELSEISKLTVIEIEENFCKNLQKEFPNINILNEDVRFVDFSEIGNDLVVFGNLPYSFSSDITFQLIEYAPFIKRAVIMLQKEFAERLAGVPNTKKYGTISILTQLKATARLGPVFSGDCFYPSAKVESQMVELTFYHPPKYEIKNDLRLKEIISATFQQRRKKITNTLTRITGLSLPELREKLVTLNIDPNKRPENLTIEEFLIMSENL